MVSRVFTQLKQGKLFGGLGKSIPEGLRFFQRERVYSRGTKSRSIFERMLREETEFAQREFGEGVWGGHLPYTASTGLNTRGTLAYRHDMSKSLIREYEGWAGTQKNVGFSAQLEFESVSNRLRSRIMTEQASILAEIARRQPKQLNLFNPSDMQRSINMVKMDNSGFTTAGIGQNVRRGGSRKSPIGTT